MYRQIAGALMLILSHYSLAEAKTYQTEPKPTPQETGQGWEVPVISVNPEAGQKRVFITPQNNPSNSLAPYNSPVYHARAAYTLTPAGIPVSIEKLHQQMAEMCPQGWIKLQEWATLQSNPPELHFQFQCLHATPQD